MMQFRLIHIFSILVLIGSLLVFNMPARAQHIDDDAILRDTANAFCKQLSLVIRQIDTHFDKAKDSLVDDGLQKTWTCKENYKMDGSRSCEIYQRGDVYMYAAFYLARDSKDALESSYHNLVQQLKDCMGSSYVYKEQKTSAAETLIGQKNFSCEMKPGYDSLKDQADMLVSVQKDSQTGNYELILLIQKHRGFY